MLQILSLAFLAVVPCVEPTAKPRLLVLTDIGGDPDDQQSMIRLMLYSNEFEIEGLIATASGTPGELKKEVTKPELIREIINAYGKVRPNLLLHRADYPEAKYLLDRVKAGNPKRGQAAIGDRNDTEGSRHIIAVVDRDDPRPVNITIWGGQTDLTQALWRVRHDRGEKDLKHFLSRIRVFDIGDQDKIATWIHEQFPDLFYILAKSAPGRDMREGAYRGMYLGGDESLTSREWVDANIRNDRGPLGALYPTRTWTAPNPHSTLKEGDTPSWFYFLPNGLSDPANPEWGCWGGRYIHEDRGRYRDAKDTVGRVTDARSTVWRWRPAFQADFAARMLWCVKSAKEANHPPVAVVRGDKSRGVVEIDGRPGEKLKLTAAGSSDPDGDALDYRWFVYPESGSYGRDVAIADERKAGATLSLPADAGRKSIHVILEVTDRGKPALSSFRRVVVRVGP